MVTDVKLVVADVKLVVPDVKLVDAGCEACGHQMLCLWTQDVNTWGQYFKKDDHHVTEKTTFYCSVPQQT